jgi:hypothetical protein
LWIRLLVEKYQTILRTWQFSDADRVAPKHVGSDIGRIIAGSMNNDRRAWDSAQETLD